MTVIFEYSHSNVSNVSRSTAGIYYPPFARISRSAENPREIASRSGRRINFARIMPVSTVTGDRGLATETLNPKPNVPSGLVAFLAKD